jgi:hypothetical protein
MPFQSTARFGEIERPFGADTTNNRDGCPISRTQAGICGQDKWDTGGSTSVMGTGSFADSAPNQWPQRLALVSRYFMERGYNTNYAAGWHLVRSAPRLNFTAGSPVQIVTGGDSTGSGLKGINSTLGPLTLRMAETSPVPMSNIGILGDGAPAMSTRHCWQGYLAYGPTLSDGSPDPFANNNAAGGRSSGGFDVDRSIQRRPSLFQHVHEQNRVLIPAQGARLDVQVDCEKSGNCAAPTEASTNTFLQDTRDWFACTAAEKAPATF